MIVVKFELFKNTREASLASWQPVSLLTGKPILTW